MSGIADQIRAEEGNLRYAYFFPAENSETVLPIDEWRDQVTLDEHRKSIGRNSFAGTPA